MATGSLAHMSKDCNNSLEREHKTLAFWLRWLIGHEQTLKIKTIMKTYDSGKWRFYNDFFLTVTLYNNVPFNNISSHEHIIFL